MSINTTSNFLDLYNSESEKGNTTTDPGDEGHSSTDPDEAAALAESWPTAPPIDLIDNVKGYEQTSFDAVSCPPPLSVINSSSSDDEDKKQPGEEDEEDSENKKPIEVVLDVESRLTEEQARTALLSHLTANHCCYGKAAAKNMEIKQMEFTPAFHYELQTFSEKRETAWTYSPIRSGFLDGGYGGIPPLPWEIEEYPTQAFKDEVRLVPVPNTASIKSCHRCRGTGGVTCRDCSGKGWSRCLNCHGDGWIADGSGHRERCFYCQHSKHGHGQQDCSKCSTKGKVNCTTCDGQGQIRCYIQLSITWKVHTAEHIVEKLDLPHDLIRDVSGQVAFEEESPKIRPLSATIPNKDIQQASNNLVSSHGNDYSDHRIVRQRHQVRVVPVTQVQYEWKNKQHSYFVYGYENRVHLVKYPQQCCWGCAIV